jgi:hypothetical protein
VFSSTTTTTTTAAATTADRYRCCVAARFLSVIQHLAQLGSSNPLKQNLTR